MRHKNGKNALNYLYIGELETDWIDCKLNKFLLYNAFLFQKLVMVVYYA